MQGAGERRSGGETSIVSYIAEPLAASPVVLLSTKGNAVMPDKNEHTGRFGGPGSSHQDKENPGKNKQEHGHKAGGGKPGAQADRMKDADGDESGGGHHYREHGRT